MPDSLPSYYLHARPEVADMLLDSFATPPEKVLDVGCGAGALGELLLTRGVKEVYGVELHEAAAHAAAKKLTGVHWGDITSLDAWPGAPYDAVVCSDVLEHLAEPEKLLRAIHGSLKPGGKIVVSIPNVRNQSVLLPLICDDAWEYQDAGVLDRTHLRFYTYTSAKDMLVRAGFTVDSAFRAVEEQPSDKLQRLVTALSLLGVAATNLLKMSCAVQYLLVGGKT